MFKLDRQKSGAGRDYTNTPDMIGTNQSSIQAMSPMTSVEGIHKKDQGSLKEESTSKYESQHP